MYKNSVHEMEKAGLKIHALANVLGITAKEVERKVYRIGTMVDDVEGEVASDFTTDEALKIRSTFFPYMSIDYLFAVSTGSENE